MTILEILQLLIAAGTTVAEALSKNPALGNVLADVQAGIKALTDAEGKAATLAELESLRTTKIWG